VTLSTPTVSTKLAQIAEQSYDGQQRVMRLSGVPLGSPAAKRVLTNRMREIFTYGSVGGAGGNPGSYPAGERATLNSDDYFPPVMPIRNH
jgi:hypothetical protein